MRTRPTTPHTGADTPEIGWGESVHCTAATVTDDIDPRVPLCLHLKGVTTLGERYDPLTFWPIAESVRESLHLVLIADTRDDVTCTDCLAWLHS